VLPTIIIYAPLPYTSLFLAVLKVTASNRIQSPT